MSIRPTRHDSGARRPRGRKLLRLLVVSLLAAGGGLSASGDAQTTVVPQEDKKYITEQRRRIEVAMAQRNFQKAANLSEKLVERFPGSHVSWMTLANCHLQDNWPLRKDSRAEEAAAKALEIAGEHPMILNALATAKFRQRRDDAEEVLSELLDRRPRPEGFDASRLADLYVMRGRLRYERAPDPEAISGAHQDFNEALKLNPNHSLGLMESAQILLDDGNIEEAQHRLETALTRIPGNRSLHHLLFRCYRSTGQRDKSRHHLAVSKLLRRLTDSLAATGAPDAEEQLEIHRELRELNPTDVNRWYNLVDLEIAAGNLDRAEAELATLKQKYPTWKPLEGLRARLDQAQAGDQEEDDCQPENPRPR